MSAVVLKRQGQGTDPQFEKHMADAHMKRALPHLRRALRHYKQAGASRSLIVVLEAMTAGAQKGEATDA